MSRKTSLKRFLSAAIAVSTCLTALPAFPAFSEENPPAAETQETAEADNSGSAFARQKTYSDYFDEIDDVPRPDQEALLKYSGCDDEAQVEVGSYEGKEDVVIWSNESGTIDFTVDVPEAGAYQMEVSYFPISDGSATEVSVLIDGVSPYDTATRVEMNHIWTNAYPISVDSKDNEVRPPQVQAPRWVTNMFYDTDGLFNEPLYFNFEAGQHTVSLQSERASVAIEYIKLCNIRSEERRVGKECL